jgi:ribose transport system ATP-binding protein
VNAVVPAVRMSGIDKHYPGVRALDGASFELRAGEVHALVGENGAGKSTLMKVLAGIVRPDGGVVEVAGEPVSFGGPRDAHLAGISTVHQELNLVPHLTVAQNIFLGRQGRRAGVFVDDAALNRRTAALFDRLNIALDPRAPASGLTVAKQQMVEIARALSMQARVLVMDEPTATLTDTEIAELFRIIRGLRADGVGVVHISHRLEELREISDRITVMRDGRTLETLATAGVHLDQVIRLMVGRTLTAAGPRPAADTADRGGEPAALEVRNLSRGRVVRDVSFSVRRGEILGIAGLVGAGRTETARLIFAADRRDGGEVLVGGRVVRLRTPRDAVAAGLAYLSEDRKQFGLALGMGVEENTVLATLPRFAALGGWIRRAQTRAVARAHVESLRIRTPGLRQKVRNLSGGNQQKVVLAKWLTADCEVLIVDEPTRGIDVGAKDEIYALLNGLAEQGRAIVMISSELPEVLRMSHRVLVMCEGRVTGELTAAEATQERIMTLATMRSAVVDTHAVDHAPASPTDPNDPTEGEPA